MFLFLILILSLQYLVMIRGVLKMNLGFLDHLIGWVPFLPYLLVIYFIFYSLFIIIKEDSIQFFETRFGFLFIKKKKRAVWSEYLRKKYN
jgi:hypothetical protein